MSPHKGYMNIAIATMLFVAAFAGVAFIADEDVSAAEGDGAGDFTVTYTYGGSSIVKKMDDGNTFKFKAEDITAISAPEGYEFDDKFIDLKSGAVYTVDQTYAFTSNVSVEPMVKIKAGYSEIELAYGDVSEKYLVKEAEGAFALTEKQLQDFGKKIGMEFKVGETGAITVESEKFDFNGFKNGESAPVMILSGIVGADAETVKYVLDITPVYAISFVADGVKIAEVKTNAEDSVFKAPANPSKENFDFKGWFDADGVEFKADKSIYTADTVFTAKFEPKTYTVHFVVDGNVFAERSSKYGYQIDLPALPDGYKAWVGADGKVVSSPVTIIGETTFTAVADVFYTITFVNGEEVVGTAKVLENTVIAPEQIPAVPEGCSGWDFDASVAVSADATVKAIPYVYYTVVFDFGDKNFDNVSVQVISGQTVPADKVPAIPENFPKADQTWNFDIEAPVVKDMTVTLRDNIYYTVTFIAGEQTVDTVSVLEKTVVAAPELPEGYKAWDFDFTAVITADTTIRAIAKENVFDVTFEIEGKTPVVQKSDSLVIPDPNVADKVFKGWVVKGQTQYVDPSTYAIKEDVTFVAIYDEAPAPAGPSFFETNEGKCVAVIIGVALLAFVYAVYTNMFGMKDLLTSIKIQRVKKE